MPNLSQPLLLSLHFSHIIPCQAQCSLWPPPAHLMWLPLKPQPPFNKPPNELSSALILNSHACARPSNLCQFSPWFIHRLSAIFLWRVISMWCFSSFCGLTPLNMHRQNIYPPERLSRKMQRSNYTDQWKLRAASSKRDVQLGFSFVSRWAWLCGL